jgi:YgiT-type zinc finger domain-containing protein
MAIQSEDEETVLMDCAVCGAELTATATDLPFKVSETSIVILKSLPVVQCGNCSAYLIEDRVLRRVDEILAEVDSKAEVEIIRYAEQPDPAVGAGRRR